MEGKEPGGKMLDRLRDFTFGSMVLRLVLALACGGVLGYGRSQQERPAGLRTYMLVCLGAASAVMISLYLNEMLHGLWAETTAEVGSKFDAARMAAQTVTGIGFLGAGIIIKVSHQQVSGLTTATGSGRRVSSAWRSAADTMSWGLSAQRWY